MPEATHLIAIGIDWSQGRASTKEFMAELEAQIARLTSGGAAGTLTPTRVGIAGANLKNEAEQVVNLLRNAKIPVPAELTKILNGGLVKELNAIKFPGFSQERSTAAISTALSRQSQKIGVGIGSAQAAGVGDDEESAAQKQLNKAAQVAALRADTEYIEATVQLMTEKKLLTAAITKEAAETVAYIDATVLAATEKNLAAAAEAEARTVNEDYVASMVLLATATNQEAATAADKLAADADYIESTVLLATSRNLEAAVIAEQLAGDQGYLESVLRGAIAKNTQSAVEKEILAANEEYLLSVRRAALAKKTLTEAEKLAAGETTAGGRGGGTGGGGRGGILGGLTGFGGGDAGFGFGSRLASSAAFFASGLALFAVTNSIRESIKQAEGLQVQMSIIKAQLESAGQTGSEQFDRISASILEVSKNTATAADQVALVTRRLAGVFANQQGTPDFSRASTEAESAFKLQRVTGLPQEEITNDLVAISKAFDLTFAQIGDAAIGIGQAFGQSEADIITFTSALAPTAKELGFTSTQLAGLGAVAIEFSGQSASSLAENFRRILPALQQQRDKIVALFDRNNLGDLGQKVAENFATGNIEQVLELMIKGYQQLNPQQQQLLASLAGNRREAGAFYSVLQNGDATLRALGTDGSQYVGNLDRRFAEVQKTVSFAFDAMKRALQSFGVALFQSGLGDALLGLAHAGTDLFNVAAKLLDIFGAINDLSHGMIGNIAGAAVEFLILQKVLTSILALKGLSFLGGLGGLFGKGAAAAANPIGFAVPAAAGAESGGGFLASVGGLGTLAAGATALLALNQLSNTRSDKQNEVNAGIASIRDSITRSLKEGKSADDIRAQLHGLGSSTDLSPGEKFSAFLSGANTDSPVKLALDELEKQDKDRRGAALQAAADFYKKRADGAEAQFKKDFPGRSEEDAKGYADSVRKTADEYQSKVDAYLKDPAANRDFADQEIGLLSVVRLDDPGTNPVFKIMQVALQDFDKKKAAAEKITAIQQNITDVLESNVANAQQLFESGRGTLDDYVKSLDEEVQGWQQIANESAKVGVHDAEAEKKVQELTKAKQQAIKSATDAAAALSTRFATITGTDTPDRTIGIAQKRVDTLAANPDSNPEDVVNARLDLAQAEQDKFKAEVSAARTAEEKLAIIRRGFQFSPEARKGLAQAEILAQANTSGLGSIAKALGTDIQNLTNSVADAMVEFGNDAKTALQNIIIGKFRLLLLQAQIAAELGNIALFIQDITAASALAGTLPSADSVDAPAPPTTGSTDAADRASAEKAAAEEARTEALAAGNARLDIEAAQARGDAVRLAQIAQERANLEASFARTDSERLAALAHMVDADNQLTKALADQRRAIRGLHVAQANNDPIIAAANALEQAQDDLANAFGDTATIQAMTALINAQHAFARALQDQADQFASVDIAQANLVGDPVKAAAIKLRLLRDRLNNAVALGLNPGEVATLQAQIIDATAQLAETQIQHGEQTIQNQLTLGRINKGQAIAQLQALKVFAKSQDEIDAIDIQIKNLTDQLGQDFKFNLPSVLGLPTLYEARRLGQSGSTGGGYQDNRIINLTINAQTGASATDIASAVVAVVGAPNQLSGFPKKYGG